MFIALELVAFLMIYRFNSYHGTSLFHSSNALAGSFFEKQSQVKSYFELAEANNKLQAENSWLRNRLKAQELRLYMSENSFNQFSGSDLRLIEAKVINNSVHSFSNNFITFNKGSNDGVEVGMSVISPDGIIGIIRSVSASFSVAYSLLHDKMQVSCRIAKTGDLATLKWDGENYLYGVLEYVPRHVKVQKGDTVVTSGFNAVFPEGSAVGIVEEVKLVPEDLFLDIKLKLAVDFSQLRNAYVVQQHIRNELDSVQSGLKNE